MAIASRFIINNPNGTPELESNAMERTPVESSNVCAVAYDPETQVMEVEFGKGTEPGEAGNRVYHYRQIPAKIYEELTQASSVGSYLNKRVAFEFPYELLGKVEDLKP